jgi:aspartate kinase
VVGEGMARQVGMAAKVFKALAEDKVNVRVIDQGASEMNIIVGVQNGDYEKAIRTLYQEMTRKD